MERLRILFRDGDRAPYLYVLQHAARLRELDLVIERTDFAGDYPGALIAGSVDVLAENYWELQSLAATGLPLVSLATTVTHLNETLVVLPSISRLDELAGKSLAMRGKGPSALIAKLWLEDRGLPGMTGSIISEQAFGRWGNWKAVVSGDCDAAFVTTLMAGEPQAAGLRSLDIDRFGFLGNITLTTRVDVTERQPEAVHALVAAAFDATRLFREDPTTCLEIMRGKAGEMMPLENDQRVAEVYAILRDELAPQPVPTIEAIGNTHRMRLHDDPELADFNPLLMWDLRFARRVAANREAGQRA